MAWIPRGQTELHGYNILKLKADASSVLAKCWLMMWINDKKKIMIKDRQDDVKQAKKQYFFNILSLTLICSFCMIFGLNVNNWSGP